MLTSQQLQCDTNAPFDAIEETVTSGASGLSYDPASGTYTYVWKTDKAWANSCRRLIVQLNDGVMDGEFRFQQISIRCHCWSGRLGLRSAEVVFLRGNDAEVMNC